MLARGRSSEGCGRGPRARRRAPAATRPAPAGRPNFDWPRVPVDGRHQGLGQRRPKLFRRLSRATWRKGTLRFGTVISVGHSWCSICSRHLFAAPAVGRVPPGEGHIAKDAAADERLPAHGGVDRIVSIRVEAEGVTDTVRYLDDGIRRTSSDTTSGRPGLRDSATTTGWAGIASPRHVAPKGIQECDPARVIPTRPRVHPWLSACSLGGCWVHSAAALLAASGTEVERDEGEGS